MKIHYVKNDWGRCIPISFVKCCDSMTLNISPENPNPESGYGFDYTTGKVVYFKSKKKIRELEFCPFCKEVIETEEKMIQK